MSFSKCGLHLSEVFFFKNDILIRNICVEVILHQQCLELFSKLPKGNNLDNVVLHSDTQLYTCSSVGQLGIIKFC